MRAPARPFPLLFVLLLLTVLTAGVPLEAESRPEEQDSPTSRERAKPAAATARDRYVRVVRESEAGVDLAIRIPHDRVRVIDDEEGTRSIAIDGLDSVLMPGSPELPVMVLSIGVPNDAEIRLRYDSDDVASSSGAPIRPVADYSETTRRLERNADSEIYSRARAWPDEQVTVDVVRYRDLRVARLTINPARYNPATGDLSVAHSLDVHLEFQGGRGFRRADGVTRSIEDRLVGRHLLNRKTVVTGWRRTSAREATAAVDPLPPTAPSVSTTVVNSGVKIRVDTSDVIRVTQEQLVGIGFDPEGVDPRNLQLSFRGTPVPCRVAGEDDGELDSGDFIEFYGFPRNERFAQENVFWLEESTESGLRFSTRDATPGAASTLTTFQHTVYFENGNSIYTLGNPSQEGDPHFYWIWFEDNPNSPRVTTFDLPATLPGLADSGNAFIRAKLFGRTNTFADPDHHLEFSVNGTVVGASLWNGQTFNVAEIPFDAAMLLPGTNEFTLEQKFIAFPDIYYLDWIEIEYPRSLVAVDDRLLVTSPGGMRHYSVSGFVGVTDPLVLDVTNPLAPVELTGMAFEGSGPFTLSFQDETATGNHYLITGDQGRGAAASLELDVPSTLRDTENGADLIIVTPDGWESSLDDLIAAREAQGLRVLLTNLSSVADEFAGGNVDDLAIRDFIAWAYANWHSPAVSFVLLVGEPNLDPQNWLGQSPHYHFMPTHFGITGSQGETISDTWFGAVDGDDIPDVAIGRFSVRTASNATSISAKILTYEGLPNTRSWMKNVIQIASNEREFEIALETAADALPSYFHRIKQYRRLGATTTSIGEALDASGSVTSFLGHGNVRYWADGNGGPFFEGSDASGVANTNKLSFITALNCLNGLIADPFSTISLSEAFHNKSRSGALAMWSPAAFGFLSQYDRLQQILYPTIFRDRVREIGASTTGALVETYLTAPVSIDMVKEMILLGDPSGPLTLPCISSPDDNCDGYDNDCDGVPDDDFPIEFTTCGVGACATTGEIQCIGGAIVDTCSPEIPAVDDETCDGTDDDCDGAVDEDFAPETTRCGVGSCERIGITSCVAGVPLDSCTPGDPAAADDVTCNRADEDCDGTADEDFIPTETTCGLGACSSTGSFQCTNGALINVCEPGLPSEEVCDGDVDNDCDGLIDEDANGEDSDADGIHNACDNCPLDFNVDQLDFDVDGFGDLCDLDDDADGSPDVDDCAPLNASLSSIPAPVGNSLVMERTSTDMLRWRASPQARTSNIYRGAIVPGSPWSYDVICLFAENPMAVVGDSEIPLPGEAFFYFVTGNNLCGESPMGTNSSGIDLFPSSVCASLGLDTDADTVLDIVDNCPVTPNAVQKDGDLDFVGDDCDLCASDFDPTQPDADEDGVGDACDTCTDIDGDGFGDPDYPKNDCHDDNCPGIDNPGQEDSDDDGIGDACDP